jgi:hypothetical protein
MKYYHITKNNKKTIDSILKKGLLCNEYGDIFLFENLSFIANGVKNYVSDHIACNQLFLKTYSMFEIDSEGITTELISDNVAELCWKQQWIVHQPFISPCYINLFGKYKTNYKNPFKDAIFELFHKNMNILILDHNYNLKNAFKKCNQIMPGVYNSLNDYKADGIKGLQQNILLK